MQINELLNKATDLLISAGAPPAVKFDVSANTSNIIQIVNKYFRVASGFSTYEDNGTIELGKVTKEGGKLVLPIFANDRKIKVLLAKIVVDTESDFEVQ